jgi:hypothetical protein
VGITGVDEGLAKVGDLSSGITSLPDGSASVSVPGADEGIAKVGALTTGITGLPDGAPAITQPGMDKALTDTKTLDSQMRHLPMATYLTFNTPGLQEAITQVGKLDTAIRQLQGKDVAINAVGAVAAKNQVDALRQSINLLQDKTVTLRTNNVTTTTGGMSGAMITGPRNMNVGERGYTEALVPLQLPLNRVDPAVRDMAALLRGGGPTAPMTGGAQKVVNNYMTITPQSADPSAVATQVINRSAALANR